MLGNFEQTIHSACIASYMADILLVDGDTMVIKIDIILSFLNMQSTGNSGKSTGGYARVC